MAYAAGGVLVLWGLREIVYRVENETMTSASIGAEEHYVLEDVLRMVNEVIEDNLQVIDPVAFCQNKKYVMLVMRRGQ